MIVGVPKEIKNHEYRVGLTPASVRELTEHGHAVLVETNAGASIGLTDDQYRAAGAEIVALDTPPKVAIKSASLESVEYEASGFVADAGTKGDARNQLFDLAHRHLEASGVMWNVDLALPPRSLQVFA